MTPEEVVKYVRNTDSDLLGLKYEGSVLIKESMEDLEFAKMKLDFYKNEPFAQKCFSLEDWLLLQFKGRWNTIAYLEGKEQIK